MVPVSPRPQLQLCLVVDPSQWTAALDYRHASTVTVSPARRAFRLYEDPYRLNSRGTLLSHNLRQFPRGSLCPRGTLVPGLPAGVRISALGRFALPQSETASPISLPAGNAGPRPSGRGSDTCSAAAGHPDGRAVVPMIAARISRTGGRAASGQTPVAFTYTTQGRGRRWRALGDDIVPHCRICSHPSRARNVQPVAQHAIGKTP